LRAMDRYGRQPLAAVLHQGQRLKLPIRRTFPGSHRFVRVGSNAAVASLRRQVRSPRENSSVVDMAMRWLRVVNEFRPAPTPSAAPLAKASRTQAMVIPKEPRASMVH
jgi:hypothetical protein